jgi:hypothetical protein
MAAGLAANASKVRDILVFGIAFDRRMDGFHHQPEAEEHVR